MTYYTNKKTGRTSWTDPRTRVEEVKEEEGEEKKEVKKEEEVVVVAKEEGGEKGVKKEEEVKKKEKEVKKEEEVKVEETAAPTQEKEKEKEKEEEEGQDQDEEDDSDSSSEESSSPPPPAPAHDKSRRRSSVPIVPPPVPVAPPPEEDSDEEETKFTKKHIQTKDLKARTVTPGDPAPLLTPDELRTVFATVDHGVVKGQLNPMLFGTLIRSITNCKNLFDEMNMFSFFNTSGDGVIDVEEFLDGCKRIGEERDGRCTVFYRGLVKYHQSQGFVL